MTTAADVDWDALIADFKTRALNVHTLPAPAHDPDAPARALYADLELRRMDFMEIEQVRVILYDQAHRDASSSASGKDNTSAPGRGRSGSSAERLNRFISSVRQVPRQEREASIEAEEQDEALVLERDAMRVEKRRGSASGWARRSGGAAAGGGFTEQRVDEVMAAFQEVRDILALRADKDVKGEVRKATPRWVQIGRAMLNLVYFLLIMPWLYVFMPLRWLHPLLRRVGLRNNYLPGDVMQKFFSRGMLALNGVRVTMEGHVPSTYENTLAMFSHTSNLDSTVVSSGPLAFKFVGKKILFYIPLFGWLMNLYGHIGIDRSNRSKAIASLDEAVRRIHRWNRSVCISPEGTRSRTGRLLDFKKGPFHVAMKVRLPITPMILIGAFECWPPSHMAPVGGDVVLRILPPMEVHDDDDYNSLLSRVRRAFLEGSKAPLLEPAKRSPFGSPLGLFVGKFFVPFVYALLFLFLWL